MFDDDLGLFGFEKDFGDLPETVPAVSRALLPGLVSTPPAAVDPPIPVLEKPSGPLGRALKTLPVAIEPPQDTVGARTISDDLRNKVAGSIAADSMETPSIKKMDRVVSPQDSSSRGGFSSPLLEKTFRKWHATYSNSTGLHPDPDSPPHNYDWRGAFLAGAIPKQDEEGNWVWPGNHITTRAEDGNRIPIPNWSGSAPIPKNPTFEMKNDMEAPVYRRELGIWRQGNKI